MLVPGSDCASYVRATRAQSPWKNGRKIELKISKKGNFSFQCGNKTQLSIWIFVFLTFQKRKFLIHNVQCKVKKY